MAWKVGNGLTYLALYSLLLSAKCHTKRNPQSKIVQSQTYLYCSDSSSSSVRHGSGCTLSLPRYCDRVNFWFINGLDSVIDFSWFNLATINTQSKPNRYPTTTAIGDEETFEVKLLYSLFSTLSSLLTDHIAEMWSSMRNVESVVVTSMVAFSPKRRAIR